VRTRGPFIKEDKYVPLRELHQGRSGPSRPKKEKRQNVIGMNATGGRLDLSYRRISSHKG